MRNGLKSVAVAMLLMATFPVAVTIAHADDWRKVLKAVKSIACCKSKGKTYLKGTCMYDADKDGFSVCLATSILFIWVRLMTGTANVSWNGKVAGIPCPGIVR